MDQILSLALRPKTLSGLIGQKSLVESIRLQATKRLPHAWIFVGGTGSGKTTVSRILATSVQCTHQQIWGDPCEACRARTNFCIHEINASEVSGVEEMGRIAEVSRYRPQSGRYRVIILDEAQLISNQGQNLLLKPFEDAPETTIWIICTTDPRKIIATLRRRCVTYQMKPLSLGACEVLLKRASATIHLKQPLEPLIEVIHENQITSPALILMALEKYATGSTAQEAALGGEVSVDSLRICKAIIAGNWSDLKANMNQAPPEDARWIRASVCGYLRGCLLKESDSKRRIAIADSMLELTGMAPLEDGLLAHWLLAVLYRSCKRLGQ